jgi:hypothetical protein
MISPQYYEVAQIDPSSFSSRQIRSPDRNPKSGANLHSLSRILDQASSKEAKQLDEGVAGTLVLIT